VTRDVPEYAIVAGAPAKILRFRNDEEVRHV
jgi:acetyltransferase-like isoleucine patch superfamily enzyme